MNKVQKYQQMYWSLRGFVYSLFYKASLINHHSLFASGITVYPEPDWSRRLTPAPVFVPNEKIVGVEHLTGEKFSMILKTNRLFKTHKLYVLPPVKLTEEDLTAALGFHDE